jgi:hypothetical protein
MPSNLYSAPTSQVMKEFMHFMAVYGRNYNSKYDMDARYKIFADNYVEIEKHNSLSEKTYTLAVGPYTDMSHEEMIE